VIFLIKTQKSIYDKPETSDGTRILVMTLWPRGISKDKVDAWIKDLGTPRELIREWKNGNLSWVQFANRYRKSLKGKEELLRSLAEDSRKGTITLLCTERDPTHCHRSLLRREIERLL